MLPVCISADFEGVNNFYISPETISPETISLKTISRKLSARKLHFIRKGIDEQTSIQRKT